MKVTIQTLKAPWPEGAKVGDVVAFEGDTAPAWAVGKFAPAPDNAEADFHYEPKVGAPDDSEQVNTKDHDVAILQTVVERLQEQLAAEAQTRAIAVAAEASARVQHEARLTVALEYIESLRQRPNGDEAAPAGKKREGLNAEAEKLGIKVDGRWSDERLAEEIAKAAKK